MDPLLTGLLNFGGPGVLAAVVLWLHVGSRKEISEERKMFREELGAERQNCTEMWAKILDLKLQHHAVVLEKLNEIQQAVRK